jgi:hypothetical protein
MIAAATPLHGHRSDLHHQQPNGHELLLPYQGMEVKDRGRVPAELVVKFKAATQH